MGGCIDRVAAMLRDLAQLQKASPQLQQQACLSRRQIASISRRVQVVHAAVTHTHALRQSHRWLGLAWLGVVIVERFRSTPILSTPRKFLIFLASDISPPLHHHMHPLSLVTLQRV